MYKFGYVVGLVMLPLAVVCFMLGIWWFIPLFITGLWLAVFSDAKLKGE